MGRKFTNKGMTDAGKRIASACKGKGWTLAELTRRCGWEDTRVYRYLRAPAIPVADGLKIARVLNVPLKALANDERSTS